jgi:hypothetical protein
MDRHHHPESGITMAAKKNPVLDNYTVGPDAPYAGIEYGIEYNLSTVSAELIEEMIARGSKHFEKKPEKPKAKEKE